MLNVALHYNIMKKLGLPCRSYLLMASVYFGLLAGKSRAGKSLESVSAVFRRRGLRYLALALVDVEATYLMQRAMQYTTLVSIQVGWMDGWMGDWVVTRPCPSN